MKHNKQTILDLKLKVRILSTIVFFGAVGGVLYVTKPPVISGCPDSGCAIVVKTVYASDTDSELAQLTAYIVKKWESHGRSEAVHALSCFISESGLRTDAVGVNNNGSNDVGIAQINSIHGMSTEDRKDWKKNIDKAYSIYKSRGWSAWYGKGC